MASYRCDCGQRFTDPRAFDLHRFDHRPLRSLEQVIGAHIHRGHWASAEAALTTWRRIRSATLRKASA